MKGYCDNLYRSLVLRSAILVSMIALIVTCTETGEPSVHPDGWGDGESLNFHGRIFWENGWDFYSCQQCHGEDLTGGVVDFSCSTCHTSGVGSCTTCHGDPDTDLAYPPKDIMNNTDSTLISIGAHGAHLQSDIAIVECEECHVVPEDYLDEGHLGTDNIAEIEFGTVASNSGVLSPTWDHSLASCENVYCHGAFSFLKSESENQWAYSSETISGNDSLAVWTAPGSVVCGTCHDLPPNGHLGSYTNIECYSCHGSVININGNIIDKTKHINGQINLN